MWAGDTDDSKVSFCNRAIARGDWFAHKHCLDQDLSDAIAWLAKRSPGQVWSSLVSTRPGAGACYWCMAGGS